MDLQKLIAQHPNILLERKSARAIFCDVFQGDIAKVNLLLTAFDEDIVSSLRQSYPWSVAEKNKYIKILQKQHSIVDDKAVWTVETWESMFSQKVIQALDQLEVAKNAAEELKKFNEMNEQFVEDSTTDPEYELGTRSEVDTFYINPTLKETDDRIYIPCGIGNTDNGFFIYGIKKDKTCHHPNADVYALVYNYLIRSSKITDDDLPHYLKNRESLYDIDYRTVFRLSVVLLQLIKNNYVNNDTLKVAFSGDTECFKYAIGLVNNYAALFCRLMKINEIKLKVANSKDGIPLCLDGNTGVFVRNNLDLVTNARELWYGRRINYHFDESSLPDLEYLLSEISPFGYFKEGQIEALTKMVSAKKHTVCIMPTGSGKSLIYYMVSILQPLPLFIVAPTDILIQDQIRNLKQFHRIDNVAHLQLTDDNNFNEYEMRNSLNYLTPTTLQNRNLLALFRYINNGSLRRYVMTSQGKFLKEVQISNAPLIGNIVLDEIHCLSNWGHDFRPEYLMLSKYLNKFLDQITFLGFTATANYTVVEDVQKQLNIPQENFISPISFEKHNITYDYRCVSSDEDMLKEVSEISKRVIARNERTIIFTKNDEVSWKVADAVGYEADVFTSSNPDAYHHFVEGKCKILVASEELGVGINFPNIRNIIHFGLPLSKSEYVQEVGRAGRASEQVCSYVIYLENSDAVVPSNLLSRSTPIEDIPNLLDGLDNDFANIYRKLTNNCPRKEVMYEKLIEMYDDFVKRGQALYVESYEHKDLHTAKQKLYMLYNVGYINDWYAYCKSKNIEGVDILIDIISTDAASYQKDPQKMILRMKNRVRAYFDELGNNRESIAKTERAKSEQEIIKVYVDWYYLKYLYHHNEQFLDLYDFITTNTDSNGEEITAAIKDYFSLPFITIKSDEASYNDMSLLEISDKIKSGLNRSTIANIERINTNRYSYRLDYLLFCANLRYNGVLESDRLERVLNNVSYHEKEIIGDDFAKLYPLCSPEGKIAIINFIDDDGGIFNLNLNEFLTAAYADGTKDIIYYGIMAEMLNMVYAETPKRATTPDILTRFADSDDVKPAEDDTDEKFKDIEEQIASLRNEIKQSKSAESAELEKKLAESEAENKELREELEEKENLKFTDEELEQLCQYLQVIVVDTCTMLHKEDLLEYITFDEAIRVPQIVIEELDKHKSNRYNPDLAKVAQRAIKNIRREVALSDEYPMRFDYEKSHPVLVSDDFDEESNDCKILSVAQRYKEYADIKVLVVTDDLNLQARAKSEDIDTCTGAEFIANRTVRKIDFDGNGEYTMQQIDFLKTKIRPTNGFTDKEVVLLKQYGITTYEAFLEMTEAEFSCMRDKKGLSFENHFMQIQKKLLDEFEKQGR